ncbi:hypothetical protein M407DRAFT_222108 [Tulasnella calospora MUT 4182]|uniref:JmjC domain-containing protein n=1 Tax=Tulasnella calospora MUT 4182 TaxID=1051891 RepID=A0A0C3MB63_9AGAM|nr:hypothetical protein M407DRAFT_222108 [Tulasnella calospora MUT 4182]
MNNEAPSDVESLSIPVPELKNLLGRCWAIQPSERSSAADCLQVIELALATNPWFTAPKAHVRVIDSSHVRLPERNVDLPRTTPRPFGVEDCPTFYPTVEEWKDPMAYITSISDRVRPCGICKVVPPEGWKMPFVMDRENFRFKTRLQRLNSIEVSSRAKINFLEQLYRFHQQQEAVGPVVPTINHKPLDLWLLRKEVYSRGGFDIVSRAKQWGGVARTMGYDGIVGVSTQLKNVYIRIILPFEQFSDHTRNSPSMSAVSPGIRYAPTSSAAARRASERTGASNQAHSRTSMPARNSLVPKGDWFCSICLTDRDYEDYGFDEGEDHSLHSFQARDLAFRKAWFEAHRPPPPPEGHNDAYRYKIGDVELREDDVEREFWRLVESPLETVEIEYGADLHSTTHGSASPSLETHPLDPYSRDGWNMNNMARAPGSLLRYVKSDISGMTVPWVYVGMVFSTFCWHNEDHYTYSVNYMHWGETKTWYGIPGDDAEKFEAAIKSEAPDLFEAQPDLLFQLVTLMSPKRLKDAGVRVYGCNQRPGEYVIAFPKAYHAGFNHGFNLNEGVNFAIPNWLNYGRDSVRQYQEHQKLPVFSHEELLITITQHSTNIKTATWLLDSLREMIDGHLTLRKKLRQAVPNILEVTEEHDVPEDQYHCAVCKGFSYLAQVTCQCMKQVACLEHWTELCGCPHTNRTLRKRFDDQQLLAILHKVQERTTAPITSDLTPQVA